MKTIEGEISSIRSLAPSASSDLELVCQKAMHKDPLQRYSSAAALAEDLRAWLDGEPLSVRRATAMSVASIWIRKNLRSALGVCFSGALCGILMGVIVGLGDLRRAAATEYSVQKLGGDASQTWVGNFSWMRELSDSWQMIQFMMVPAVAVCAFLCVLFVKPKSREANIASGLTSGFIAAAVAFLLAGGWGLLGKNSVDRGYRDIELLSTAMWLESDRERQLVQKALVDRYPGLADMNNGERQRAVRQKILHFQRAGLTPDLWLGVLASVFFVGLPMSLACILSGSMWSEGIRGWQWFGCTWERAAYLLILFLVLSLWFSPLKPAMWLILLSPILLLTALFVAVRVQSLWWRLAMVPIPFVCMFMIAADFDAMNSSIYRAGKATTDSELREALLPGDQRLAQVRDPFNRFRTSIGWLYLGDKQRYQKHCRKLNSNFNYAWQPGVASQLAKACMLRPDLQQADDIERAIELSEFATGFDSDVDIKWFQSTRALVEVRCGNFEQALDWNRKCRDGEENKGNGYRHAISYAVDALASIGLGNEQQARQSLKNGRLVHGRAVDDAMEDGFDSNWHDRQFFLILEKEIEAKFQ